MVSLSDGKHREIIWGLCVMCSYVLVLYKGSILNYYCCIIIISNGYKIKSVLKLLQVILKP